MKLAFCSLVVISFGLLLCVSALCAFLPEPNGDEFDLEYGESIVGKATSPPGIDGNLDDWRYAVWIAFDSKDELFRGQGAWKGKDDLSIIWSTMYDDNNFYFAAAVTDDMFTPSPNAAEPWLGDCLFLYIDWEDTRVLVSGKINFALTDDKAKVIDFSPAPDPQLGDSEIAIVPNEALGDAGMIYEIAMPFKLLTNVDIEQGSEIGFTPGYDEGIDNMEEKADTVFMCWFGLLPDTAANLGKLIFGGPLAVEPVSKLATTWGKMKE